MGAKKGIMNDYEIQEEMRMAVITMMQRMWMQQLMMLPFFMAVPEMTMHFLCCNASEKKFYKVMSGN